ncbi:hypothetical protein [Motiliproteus sp. SC1-56]|uniref:hypothetical protein n=1 Tax=Motiliproteus sp. SC1-56 TaxID=2799565 RepID=UPI001A8EBB63|nr:hypothetical protein [Motiliproteus sp. SC1-56]
MPVSISYIRQYDIVLIKHFGTLKRPEMARALNKTDTQIGAWRLALVDFSEGDLSALSLIDIDTFAARIKEVAPALSKVAIVRSHDAFSDYCVHSKYVCELQQIEAAVFDYPAQARAWLLNS